MKPDNLRIDERASIALRALYHKYGYLPYQVNTFEEYDLYMKNRPMLMSEQILTFPGAGGALMALNRLLMGVPGAALSSRSAKRWRRTRSNAFTSFPLQGSVAWWEYRNLPLS